MITVCKGCPKRYPGCHDKCEWYKAELNATRLENQRRRSENAAGYEASKNWNYDCRGIKK